MDLLSAVATAMLMKIQAEEAQEIAVSNAYYPTRLASSTSERVDKENVSPTHRERAPSTREAKATSLPAISRFPTDTPSSHRHSSSKTNHVIDYNESSTDDAKVPKDASFHEETPRPGNHKAVYHIRRPYWMQKDWIPTIQVRHQNGRIETEQKPPAVIRQELLRYLKLQKKTKTALLLDLGVNSNSFRKFMDADNYKEPWRAVENGTYWAAARYLEAERVDPDRTHTSVVTNFYHPMQKAPQPQTSKSSSKRKAGLPAASLKRHKNNNREDAIEQMQQIVDTPCDATEDRIYETCPYIIEQIEKYLELPGVSKSNFCAVALRGIDRKALDRLLSIYSSMKVNHWQSHSAYRRAWVFFEQKRIDEGQAKSKQRLQIEKNYPEGLPCQAITGEYVTEPTKRRGRTKRDTA